MAQDKQDIEFTGIKKVEVLEFVKKKRRWAFFWGFLVGALILSLIFSASEAEPSYPRKMPQIARIDVEGVIMDDEYRLEMLREISERGDVHALIVNINSPGGGVYASEELYEHIRKIGEEMPVVALMRDMAASGGYITALAGDHIIAGQTTVTGSIGVISEIPNVSDLMENLGIETTVVRSSDAKGGISPFRDPTEDEIDDQEALINGMYQWFRDLVGERRGIEGGALNRVTQGAVYTGDQALALELVDEIGGYDEALAYLEAQDENLGEIEVVEWEPLYPQTAPQAYMGALLESSQQKLNAAMQEAQIPSFQAILK